MQLLKPKKIRLGNWEADPLSKAQLQYAATDAFASWFLYEVMIISVFYLILALKNNQVIILLFCISPTLGAAEFSRITRESEEELNP